MDEGTLMDTVRVSGEDRVLFSVDYPFEDAVEIGGWFDRLGWSGRTKWKIGEGNARSLLRLGG